MDTLIYWFNSLENILAVLAFIVGLWMAGRMLPTVLAWLNSGELQPLLSRPYARIPLWLALGALLSFPLVDLVGWLAHLVSILVLPEPANAFSTLLGTVSPRTFSTLPILLMLLVYGATIWFANTFLSAQGRVKRLERIFIVMSVASLIYRGVYGVFPQVFAFEPPIVIVQHDYGAPGFWFETLLGFVLIGLILVGLDHFLPGHPLRGE